MSFPFTALPLELQRQCLTYLNVKSCKAARLASRLLAETAREVLFSTVKLLPTDESVEKLMKVLQDDQIKKFVRKVEVSTSVDSEPSSAYGGRSYQDDTAETTIPEVLEDVVRRISEFPNMIEVELNFASECASTNDSGWDKEVVQDVQFRSEILENFFGSLNKEAVLIDTLSINYLQDFTEPDIYESADFKAVISKIKRLHLQVATEYDDAAPEHSIDIVALHQFFNKDLFANWLLPTKDQLTHLTLYCDTYWGMYPACDLTQAHFPNLKSLSLGNFSIAHEWQIDWILSHENTLEELFLDDCPIVHAMRMSQRQYLNRWDQPRGGTGRGLPPHHISFQDMRWHTVLPLLQSKLKHLRKFAMDHGRWRSQRAFERRYELSARLHISRYCIFDFGRGPSAWVEGMWTGNPEVPEYSCGWTHREKTQNGENVEKLRYPDCAERDQKALEDLLVAIGQPFSAARESIYDDYDDEEEAKED